jgi:hypothetical protein
MLDIVTRHTTFRVADSAGDIPAIVHLAREAHAESRFRDISFSEEKVRKLARRAMDDPKRHAVMLSHRHGEPVGFLYCSVGEYHIGTGVLIATIHNMNVARSRRHSLSGGRIFLGLLSGAKSWAVARGAREILLHVTSGVELERVHRTAKRSGLRFIGGNYVHTL